MKRNRNKIHEIIYFVQMQREELDKTLNIDHEDEESQADEQEAVKHQG